MPIARNLPWIDGVAAAGGGAALLLLSAWLSGHYGLPPGLLRGMGVMGLLYAAYAFSLAIHPARPRWMLYALILANAAWAAACFVMAAWFAGSASWLGSSHLGLEGTVVGSLAACEWRWRDQILGEARR